MVGVNDNDRNVVIVDLDGTLSDCSAREHLAQAKKWDDFHSGLSEDRPHEDVLGLLQCLPTYVEIAIVTGRPNKYRNQTSEWLFKYDVPCDEIIMRPDNCFLPDAEVKISEFESAYAGARSNFKHPNTRVGFVLDDRDKVVEAWRNAGYNCWQVRHGGY